MIHTEVLLLGGGLAGLTAAIHLSKMGLQVTVLEKNSYPKHKVCGEYISNEVLGYLKGLDLNLESLHPTKISKLQFSTSNGTAIDCVLPLGGFGISRYALDAYLYQQAKKNGCNIEITTVENVVFKDNKFTVTTTDNSIFEAGIVIGAYGKRSNIDVQLQRKFTQKKSDWLAVKGHYEGDFPNDLVGLHNFKGGYCGVSKVEDNKINVCYLADYETFKGFKNIEAYQEQVVSQNPHLKPIFENWKLLFDKPISISQISFDQKEAVENHILMIGDTAGLIHPLCGNGMAMAIHSAKLVSELVYQYSTGAIKSRKELEEQYQQAWRFNFNSRLRVGRFISKILQQPMVTAIAFRALLFAPFLLPKIISKTHGKALL